MATVEEKGGAKLEKYCGLVEQTHPDVFNINAMPPQPAEKKPGQLPEHMIKQFFEEVRETS
jgi:hypothetical protein